MGVRYWQVHLMHDVDGGEAAFVEVIGVVADSAEVAIDTCRKALSVIDILSIEDRGPVRFIVHRMIGPNTKTFVDGVPVDASQAE